MSRSYSEYTIRARPLALGLVAGAIAVLATLAIIYRLFGPFPNRGPGQPAPHTEGLLPAAQSVRVQQSRLEKKRYLQSGQIAGKPEMRLRIPIDQAMDRVVQNYQPQQVDQSRGQP